MAGSAALFVAGLALLAIAPAMKILGSMKLEEIGLGILSLAAVLLVLGAAGAVMTPVIPTLLGLGGAMILLGVGMGAAGVGLFLFASALSILAVSGAAGVAALVLIITSIVGLVPMLVDTLGRAILILIEVLVAGAPALLDGIVTLITILLDGLILLIPKIVEVILVLIESLVVGLEEKMPVILEAGYKLLMGILEGIRSNMDEILTVAFDIVNAYLNGIAERLPELVDSGWNLMLAWVGGLKAGVENHLPALIVVTQELGFAIAAGLLKGLFSGQDIVRTGMISLAAIMVNGFKAALGIESPSTVFVAIAGFIIGGLVLGITNNIPSVTASFKTLFERIVSYVGTVPGDMVRVGGNIISGIIVGINNNVGDVIGTVKNLAKAALDAFENAFDINSPAGKLIPIGMYIDRGLAKGIFSNTGVITDSVDTVGSSVIDRFNSVFGRISDIVSSDMDLSPTIKPVIDMDSVDSGIKTLDGLFKNKQLNLELAARSASGILERPSSREDPTQKGKGEGRDITFIQNNNSPKALSAVDIYRQTRNLLIKRKEDET
jgi:hypothetical protein